MRSVNTHGWSDCSCPSQECHLVILDPLLVHFHFVKICGFGLLRRALHLLFFFSHRPKFHAKHCKVSHLNWKETTITFIKSNWYHYYLICFRIPDAKYVGLGGPFKSDLLKSVGLFLPFPYSTLLRGGDLFPLPLFHFVVVYEFIVHLSCFCETCWQPWVVPMAHPSHSRKGCLKLLNGFSG